MFDALIEFFKNTGLYFFGQPDGWKNIIMIILSLVLLYLAIFKKFEPYLLIPIGFAMLLVNLPNTDLFHEIKTVVDGVEQTKYSGFLGYLYYGVKLGIYPSLIFLGIGATTDFGPLIANPKSMLLGAAAQIGIFLTFLGAILLGFSGAESAAIGIIGGADGPTSILLSSKLAPELIGPISLAAYSYMALVPIIQPPIIRLLTTKKERSIKMQQLRDVKPIEKILFSVIVTVICILLIPSSAPIIGMLMLGNLIKESKVVPHLTKTAGESLLYIVTILLGLSIGATTSGTAFLKLETLMIIGLGLFAFAVATAFGVIGGKVMCKLTHGKINPIIGAAGVSAVPMAARVVHKEGQREDQSNYLLMHAMGPNVAGVIGSAIAAGLFLMFF
ncbi:MAG: sodium ion-translocating decarboxylase subunit beta [Candidatus Izemoplasmatales bacterium]|nr:sodium ion-translocating decarboxylase subunit beta [Candidatus Izemoplasmatales bacterium]MDY0139493.1 sodium ion-translocating decarboxylase subunit beta [Candidatus Izemoplasmatales bacterium]